MTKIRLSGCDDDTSFEVEATPEQVEFLRLLSRLSYATSKGLCQPVLIVDEEIMQREKKGRAAD